MTSQLPDSPKDEQAAELLKELLKKLSGEIRELTELLRKLITELDSR